MLQLSALNRRTIATLTAAGTLPETLSPAALGEGTERAIAALRAGRQAQATGLERWFERLDRAIRTDRPERFDDPALPDALRDAQTLGLHRHNRLVGAYRRFVDVLEPHLRAGAARRGGPARALELACGSGDLSLAVARLAARRRLPVELVGSDLAASSVAQANARAAARGAPVRFVQLDATALDALGDGSFDVAFMAQSAHHFPPGVLARVIAAAARVARTVVIIDGRRSLALFPLLAVTNVPLPVLYHDSFISARKFYSEEELRLIGTLAVGADRVEVRPCWPGWSTLVVSG